MKVLVPAVAASSRPYILLVDDEQLCALVKDYLCVRGFDVTSARDGASGIRSASLNGPWLIVLDVMTPGLDGFAVHAEIRRNCDTPAMLMSRVAFFATLSWSSPRAANAFAGLEVVITVPA